MKAQNVEELVERFLAAHRGGVGWFHDAADLWRVFEPWLKEKGLLSPQRHPTIEEHLRIDPIWCAAHDALTFAVHGSLGVSGGKLTTREEVRRYLRATYAPADDAAVAALIG